jgi:hypothetical protein
MKDLEKLAANLDMLLNSIERNKDVRHNSSERRVLKTIIGEAIKRLEMIMEEIDKHGR